MNFVHILSNIIDVASQIDRLLERIPLSSLVLSDWVRRLTQWYLTLKQVAYSIKRVRVLLGCEHILGVVIPPVIRSGLK